MKKKKEKKTRKRGQHRNNAWEFHCGEKVIDKLSNCLCKILVQNSSNIKLERRFYVETTEDQMQVHRWRTAIQLGVA